MYAACGAVSFAEHEKLKAELEEADEFHQETKDILKKEKKARREAEKKIEETEAEIAERTAAKKKVEVEKKSLVTESQKKQSDLDSAKQQVEKLKSDLEMQRQAAEEAARLLAKAKEDAEKVQAELARKAEEAERLAKEAEKEKEEVSARIEEVTHHVHELEEEIIEERIRHSPVWSTGLCSCCARPGGFGLCLQGFCCPCLILGKLNATLRADDINPCPGGCFGGCCLGCCCMPCYLRSAGPAIAQKNGKEESKCKACCLGTWCSCCYLSRAYRETLIMADTDGRAEAGNPIKAPMQQSMDGGSEDGEASGKPEPDKRAHKWSTGLLSCCASPGGCSLCCKTVCCPCLVTKSLNSHLISKEIDACCPSLGGCGGCCFGCCCLPCFMCKAGPGIASEGGHQEGKCGACIKACCCPCCYLGQVHREVLLSEAL